jgi:hypothetical protein
LKYFFIAIISLYSFKSYSGLLLEPYAGFDFSSGSVSWINLEVGGRAGYVMDIFMVGLDFDYKSISADYETSKGNSQQDTMVNNTGLFAGWMWDTWALRLKYYFNSNWRIDESGPNGSSGTKIDGNGFGLDGAYRLSKHFSINLEITNINYGGDNPDTTDYLISASFPFDLVTK